LSCGWRRLEPIRVEWNIPSVGEIVGAFLWSEAIEHVAVQGLRNVGELIAIVRDDGDTRLLDVARQVLQVLAKSRSRRRLQRWSGSCGPGTAPISFSAGDCSQTAISAPRRCSAGTAARPPHRIQPDQ
jgi:hypothetical protein